MGFAYPPAMKTILLTERRALLRDFTEADRPDFIAYQTEARYRQLYDFGEDPLRANGLFDLFLSWQQDRLRRNTQLAICDPFTNRVLGCGGLREIEGNTAVFGIELAPASWGRFRLAFDASVALLRYGFEVRKFAAIVGDTASGNHRVEKFARYFGATIVAQRSGPEWMQKRGWHEVDWEITAQAWKKAKGAMAQKPRSPSKSDGIG